MRFVRVLLIPSFSHNGEMVAMGVKEALVWRALDKERVALSEGGAVSKVVDAYEGEDLNYLVSSGQELTAGGSTAAIRFTAQVVSQAPSTAPSVLDISRNNIPVRAEGETPAHLRGRRHGGTELAI
jgi:hypothetical protein